MNTPIDFQYESERRPISIREEAAEWLLRWHCGDLSISERVAYVEWLKTSPVHIAETLRACRLYSWLDSTKPLPFEFGHAVELPVVQLELQYSAGGSRRAREYQGVRWRSIATITAILSVGFGALTMAGAVLQDPPPPAQDAVSAVSDAEPQTRERKGAVLVACGDEEDRQRSHESKCVESGIRSWSMLNWQGLCGFALVVPLMVIILIKRKKLAIEDVGPLFATFMSATGIPVAVLLCSVVLPIPHGFSEVAFPEQYAVHVAAAGLALLAITVTTICQLYAAQFRGGKTDSSQAVPAPNVPARNVDTLQPDQERKVG